MRTQEQNDDLEFQNQLNTLLADGQSLLISLQNINLKNESNYHCKFFEYLDRASIAQFICPYLEIKDMLALRSTCRLMNQTVSSMRNLLLYSYYIKKKYKSMQPKEKPVDIEKLNSNLGAEDIQIQVESLKSINEFLKNKLFESEKIIKVFKNDIEYLKGESKVQEEMTTRLKDTLEQSREEQENIIENLRKDNDGLKKDKTKLATAIVQMKKITEDLKKKNASKAEALLAIKNFFMNSTLVKLKEIEGFKEAEENEEKNNKEVKATNNEAK